MLTESADATTTQVVMERVQSINTQKGFSDIRCWRRECRLEEMPRLLRPEWRYML